MQALSGMHNAITDVPGIRVGHSTNLESGTGCTVVLCEAGAVGGVDVRGSAPGSRETELLKPTNLVQEAHAILLSGGSAFGLDAASGVMRYLEERGIGFRLAGYPIPIVPAAIIFDLGVITHLVRPRPQEGYYACQVAASGPVEEGSVGVGTGATAGKALGLERAVKGGVGTASLALGNGILVGAIMAINPYGSVVDPDTGRVVAGPRNEENNGFYNTLDLITSLDYVRPKPKVAANTCIGVVATNASLTKEQANKLASQSHDGLALAVRPAHTMSDGDTIFALATGETKAPVDMTRLGAACVRAVSQTVLRAVLKATALGGIPAAREITEDATL